MANEIGKRLRSPYLDGGNAKKDSTPRATVSGEQWHWANSAVIAPPSVMKAASRKPRTYAALVLMSMVAHAQPFKTPPVKKLELAGRGVAVREISVSRLCGGTDEFSICRRSNSVCSRKSCSFSSSIARCARSSSRFDSVSKNVPTGSAGFDFMTTGVLSRQVVTPPFVTQVTVPAPAE